MAHPSADGDRYTPICGDIHSPADTNLPGVSHEDQLAEWREQLDIMGDTTATFEWAFRWLADNRPAPSPPHLVHGDFRMGNLIVDLDRPWTGGITISQQPMVDVRAAMR